LRWRGCGKVHFGGSMLLLKKGKQKQLDKAGKSGTICVPEVSGRVAYN